MLAGLVRTPAEDNPLADPAVALERRNEVLERMHELGHLTGQELTELSARPVGLAPADPPPNGCVEARIAGFFCDYVLGQLTGRLGIARGTLENDGLTIRTT